MEHEKLVKMKIGPWTLEGYAIAGYFSCIMIKELRLAFDMGVCPIKATQCETVCITHGHHDHCAGVYRHNRYRRITKEMKEKWKRATYLVPFVCVRGMIEQNSGFRKLDTGNTDEALTPLNPRFVSVLDDMTFEDSEKGTQLETFDIAKDKYIKPFATIHGVPSVGYTVWERRSKLKDEYRGLSGKEIGELKRKGVMITRSVDVPLISYSGDTIIAGVLNYRDTVLKSNVLIMECTIIDDSVSVEETQRRGHIHLDEIVSNCKSFSDVGTLVLCHLSKRYSNLTSNQVRGIVARKIRGTVLEGKVRVFILDD